MKFAIRSTPSPLFRFEKLKGRSPRILVASRSLTRSVGHDPSPDEARRRARLVSRYGAMHALRQRRRARGPSSAAAHRIDASWSTSRCPPRSRAPSPKTSAETQFLHATPRPGRVRTGSSPGRALGARHPHARRLLDGIPRPRPSVPFDAGRPLAYAPCASSVSSGPGRRRVSPRRAAASSAGACRGR
jgi:hypothetical protein